MTRPKTPDKWTPYVAVVAGMLYGRGLTYGEIGADPRVDSSAGAVGMFLNRNGLGRDSRAIRLPDGIDLALMPAAKARGKTPAMIAAELVSILAADSALLDNVLDDGVVT